ncbi:hypothetical protein OHA25_60225 (plasmid) [Nonomuraea sp. NBC_00507]|uniref:hypothetical protein n=1 Tax=Nonomuraea sp. NBC_00507 TaxID=2976002 RepID=UPI002E17C6D2
MTAITDQPQDRARRDQLADALLDNAPYLGHQWSTATVDRYAADPQVAVPLGALHAAVMLLTEMGRMLPYETLGDLATRTGAQLQNAVPDESIPRLKRALEASRQR